MNFLPISGHINFLGATFYYFYNEASYHSIAHPATEAHDDNGLPHTLEHLVFMGSENYPYKVKHIMFDKSISEHLVPSSD